MCWFFLNATHTTRVSRCKRGETTNHANRTRIVCTQCNRAGKESLVQAATSSGSTFLLTMWPIEMIVEQRNSANLAALAPLSWWRRAARYKASAEETIAMPPQLHAAHFQPIANSSGPPCWCRRVGVILSCLSPAETTRSGVYVHSAQYIYTRLIGAAIRARSPVVRFQQLVYDSVIGTHRIIGDGFT